jgi:hypothetical protein
MTRTESCVDIVVAKRVVNDDELHGRVIQMTGGHRRPVDPGTRIGGGSDMAGVSRRTFLGRGSMAVAAAGVLSSVPGLSGLLAAGETEAPAADASMAGADAGAANLSEPLVAHVRDLSTGEISLFNGTKEVIVRNPQLASQLARAVR